MTRFAVLAVVILASYPVCWSLGKKSGAITAALVLMEPAVVVSAGAKRKKLPPEPKTGGPAGGWGQVPLSTGISQPNVV